jgi:serine/threonine protein phosphatase 1
MRTLAIGDIHGCLAALDLLLARVEVRPDDRLIALGDYVDRGPDSRGVLDRVIKLHETGQLIALRGNHDAMMLDARKAYGRGMWLAVGGRETLQSYGVAFPEAFNITDVPDRHWRFLEDDLRDWYEIDTHFFVHAGVYYDIPLDEQPEDVLLWEKLHEPLPHVSGKVMVCGHTKQKSGVPLNLGHAVCIDTGVYEPDGWLTCLDVRTGQYWQANQRGQTLTSRLEEPPDQANS